MRMSVASLLFVLFIDIILFMANTAAVDIGAPTTMYNYDGSIIEKYNKGTVDHPVLKNFNSTSLPSEIKGVDTSGGNPFTDTFSTIKNWLLDVTGVSFLLEIINAFPNFLSSIGLPEVFVFVIGFLWHAYSIFMFILFLKGDA